MPQEGALPNVKHNQIYYKKARVSISLNETLVMLLYGECFILRNARPIL
jgi:hypothetical protein